MPRQSTSQTNHHILKTQLNNISIGFSNHQQLLSSSIFYSLVKASITNSLPRFNLIGFQSYKNMHTFQTEGRTSESRYGLLDQSTTSTSASYNLMNSNTISNLPEQGNCNQYNSNYCAPYPTITKRVIRFKRVYSTRTRGRSGPLQSLSRKLDRFKIRTVVVEVASNPESAQKK